jgi:hypothetical protein
MPAKADTRPAYRAAVSLARLSPPCLLAVALAPSAPVEQHADVLVASARVDLLAQAGQRQRGDAVQLGMAGDITVECALDGGQFQAAVLTGCWAWRSSYCAGLR